MRPMPDLVFGERQNIDQFLPPAALIQQRFVTDTLTGVTVEPAALRRRVDFSPHVVWNIIQQLASDKLVLLFNLSDWRQEGTLCSSATNHNMDVPVLSQMYLASRPRTLQHKVKQLAHSPQRPLLVSRSFSGLL